MTARDDILARLRTALDARESANTRLEAAAARLAKPPRVTAPARVQNVDLVDAFLARAAEVGATTARVTRVDLGAAVADYLRARNLPHVAKLSPEIDAWQVEWPASLNVTAGGASADDLVGITLARAGVAETGTVVMAAGAQSPTKLNYLPETHIAVLHARNIVATYEQALDKVRGADKAALLPRTVNWITGPSRTADIEQTLLVGVHGPKRIHIVIVEELT